MNKQQLLKMIGQAVKIRPAALRMDIDTGQPLPRIDDLWQIERPAHNWALIRLDNQRTGHVADLGGDNIQEFRTPNYLLLKAQIIITQRGLFVEPLPDARA